MIEFKLLRSQDHYKPHRSVLSPSQLQNIIDKCQQDFVPFGDAKAQETGDWGGYFTSAVKLPGTNMVCVQKDLTGYGDISSLIVNAETGVSTPTVIDPSDRNDDLVLLQAYQGYLISAFLHRSSIRVSKDGINVYTSTVSIKSRVSDCPGNRVSSNSNRNVQLEGDMLYFIDTNSNIVIFDLKKLLDMPLETRGSYAPLNGPMGKFEDFCVSKRRVTTLTQGGVVVSRGRQTRLPTQSDSLCHFNTIETLGGYFVVASYDFTNEQRVYWLMGSDLRKLGRLAVKSEAIVQNMLLLMKEKSLRILAASNWLKVDYIVWSGKELRSIKSFRVNEGIVFGLVWIVDGEQALVCGDGLLKSIKL